LTFTYNKNTLYVELDKLAAYRRQLIDKYDSNPSEFIKSAINECGEWIEEIKDKIEKTSI